MPDLDDDDFEANPLDEEDDDYDDDGDEDDVDDEDWDLTPEGTVAILERAIAEGASFMHGNQILMPTGQMRCRVCGCTDERACPGGCVWVAPNLCSRCLA